MRRCDEKKGMIIMWTPLYPRESVSGSIKDNDNLDGIFKRMFY